MGNECTVCSCNEQKELEDTSVLHFDRQKKLVKENQKEIE